MVDLNAKPPCRIERLPYREGLIRPHGYPQVVKRAPGMRDDSVIIWKRDQKCYGCYFISLN